MLLSKIYLLKKKLKLDVIDILFGIHKSLYINFRYFNFRDAIKFPVLVSKNTHIKSLKGQINIDALIEPLMILIGFGDVSIFNKNISKSVLEINGLLIFHGKAKIGHGSKISIHHKGCLDIGNNFILTAESTIVASHNIKIGNNVLLSWEVLIMDTDFHKILNEKNEIINPNKGIIIEDKVWISCRCTIIKGSFIPKNNIIASNTVVHGLLAGENKIFGSNPVKIIKENISWEI